MITDKETLKNIKEMDKKSVPDPDWLSLKDILKLDPDCDELKEL